MNDIIAVIGLAFVLFMLWGFASMPRWDREAAERIRKHDIKWREESAKEREMLRIHVNDHLCEDKVVLGCPECDRHYKGEGND